MIHERKNLTEYLHDLYTRHTKHYSAELNPNKWKDKVCCGLEESIPLISTF